MQSGINTIRRHSKSILILALLFVVCMAAGLVCLFCSNRHDGYIIALDAGHGGNDPGAVGFIQEIDLTEPAIRYLEAYLRQDENYTPVLCRPYGKGASIQQRNQAAKQAGADLLLSVHANSSDNASASGFECYPSPPGRDNHTASVRFAAILVEHMHSIGTQIRAGNGIRYAYYIPGEDGKYQKKLVDSSDTQVYPYGSFGLVENKTCPAVLAEQCFLTNAQDVAFLGTDEGCQLAAKSYYLAICEYFGTTPVFTNP